MSIDAVISDLKSIYKLTLQGTNTLEERVSDINIENWTNNLSISRSDLYNKIALYLANEFHNHQLPFLFCDAVVTDIAGMIFGGREELPDLFWSVYLAFDAGEYPHGRNRDEDPIAVYTRPMIAHIIAKHA